MTESEPEPKQGVTVHVKYGGVEQTFSGSFNDVWVSVNRFFSELVPAFDVARKMTLTVDLDRLIEDLKDVVAIAPEGPAVLLPREKLTDGEALRLYLLAVFVGYRLGKLPSETMTKEELASKLGKSAKITATRLGELVKEGNVVRAEDGSFKISTLGVKRLQEELIEIKKEIW